MFDAHVDNFCWGGYQTFTEDIISPIKKIFNVGSKSSKIFCYLGLDLNQNEIKQNLSVSNKIYWRDKSDYIIKAKNNE